MKNKLKIVTNWYNDKRSYEYMPEATKNGLKATIITFLFLY